MEDYTRTDSSLSPGPIRVDIDDLLLDRENPRLAAHDVETSSQEELLSILWREMEVNEIALSIARNGWFEHEALLVIPAAATEWASDEESKYVVIEGNRRLVAVRVLNDAALTRELGGEVLAEAVSKGEPPPETLPVQVFPERRDLWQYVGFEHVNGAKPWDALSKAKYVWDVHEQYEQHLDDIAAAIGDTHSTVQRLFRGYAVLRQAEEEFGVFTRGQERQHDFYFSHLYTALNYQQFKDYLGIDEAKGLSGTPVPEDHGPQLEQVFLWLYGDENRDVDPVIERQYPDLNDLREVVGDARAVAVLQETGDLEEAYVVAVGRSRMFMQSVREAENSLQYAQSLLNGVEEEPEGLRETLEHISNSVEMIGQWFSTRKQASQSGDGEAGEAVS